MNITKEEGVWISDVLPNSPAEICGLWVGDKIVSFGDCPSIEINQIKSDVESHLNTNIGLTIVRKDITGADEVTVLMFSPRAWSGQGYTGFALKTNTIF